MRVVSPFTNHKSICSGIPCVFKCNFVSFSMFRTKTMLFARTKTLSLFRTNTLCIFHPAPTRFYKVWWGSMKFNEAQRRSYEVPTKFDAAPTKFLQSLMQFLATQGAKKAPCSCHITPRTFLRLTICFWLTVIFRAFPVDPIFLSCVSGLIRVILDHPRRFWRISNGFHLTSEYFTQVLNTSHPFELFWCLPDHSGWLWIAMSDTIHHNLRYSRILCRIPSRILSESRILNHGSKVLNPGPGIQDYFTSVETLSCCVGRNFGEIGYPRSTSMVLRDPRNLLVQFVSQV